YVPAAPPAIGTEYKVPRFTYLASRTRWRATRRDPQARWRGTPDGRVLTVYPNKRGPGWCWCIGSDDEPPVFSPEVYRTRELAKRAALVAAGIESEGVRRA